MWVHIPKLDLIYFHRYVKEFVILFNGMFISMDDKCKVAMGEPGTPIAAVARGKEVWKY